ncbi:MAG: DsrE/DsrF/DrsH-like family protein [Dehalococcoidia bacterium]|nr:DsrE/DsrF/DrsH-like family protein [Dehalococcoidia bacterium]
MGKNGTNLPEKGTLIISSGSWERFDYALSIAITSLASGMEFHALFTHGALKRLVKGQTDVIRDETTTEIKDGIQKGLAKGTVEPLSSILKEAKSFGLKIYACPAAMANLNIARNELIEEVDSVKGLASFLQIAREATLNYYI